MFLLLAEVDLGFFENLATNYGGWIAVVLLVILLAEKVVAITPNKVDDKWAAILLKPLRGLCKIIALKIPDIDRIKVKDEDKKIK